MNRHVSGGALLLAFAASSVSAQAITPTGSFGAIPTATFNGTPVASGIPNDRVERAGSLGDVLIGLTATQRYTSPTVTDDGAGTYFANTGYSTGAPVNAPNSAWNFDFFIGGTNAGAYDYVLRYDFDPGVGTLKANHGTFTFFSSFVTLAGTVSDSWNLAFAFLGTSGPISLPGPIPVGVVSAPPGPAFDANNPGEYTFELDQVVHSGIHAGDIANTVAIRVNVTATPEPATFGLLGMGLLGLVGIARRRRA